MSFLVTEKYRSDLDTYPIEIFESYGVLHEQDENQDDLEQGKYMLKGLFAPQGNSGSKKEDFCIHVLEDTSLTLKEILKSLDQLIRVDLKEDFQKYNVHVLWATNIADYEKVLDESSKRIDLKKAIHFNIFDRELNACSEKGELKLRDGDAQRAFDIQEERAMKANASIFQTACFNDFALGDPKYTGPTVFRKSLLPVLKRLGKEFEGALGWLRENVDPRERIKKLWQRSFIPVIGKIAPITEGIVPFESTKHAVSKLLEAFLTFKKQKSFHHSRKC